MTILVVAPLLEPLEDRMDHALRVLLQVTINRDVARIPDLFREIDTVENKLRLKIGVFLRV